MMKKKKTQVFSLGHPPTVDGILLVFVELSGAREKKTPLSLSPLRLFRGIFLLRQSLKTMLFYFYIFFPFPLCPDGWVLYVFVLLFLFIIMRPPRALFPAFSSILSTTLLRRLLLLRTLLAHSRRDAIPTDREPNPADLIRHSDKKTGRDPIPTCKKVGGIITRNYDGRQKGVCVISQGGLWSFLSAC